MIAQQKNSARRTCPSNVLNQKKLDMREKVLRIQRMQMLIINNRFLAGPIRISGVIVVVVVVVVVGDTPMAVEVVVDTPMDVEVVAEVALTMMTATHSMINLVNITPGVILIIGEEVLGVAVVVGIIATMLRLFLLVLSPTRGALEKGLKERLTLY